jgi:gliding motility-associated-like protein
MKSAMFYLSIFLVVLIASCRKECIRQLDICDNLKTDTLGTGDSARIYVPYAFTPNGDGMNDLFIPIAYNVKSWRFEIYDNCNDLLFSSTQPGVGWDGGSEVSHNESHYYRIQAVTSEGHNIGLCGEFLPLECIPRGFELHHFTYGDQFSYDGLQFMTNEMLSPC